MIPSSAFGIAVNFPQAAFENGIRFAMEMGTPNEESKRATFIFPSTGTTYWLGDVQVLNPRVDRDGSPLDPEVEEREAPSRRVQVNCAVEVEYAGVEGETPVGSFHQSRLVITLLEAEYQLVKGCQAVEYNGDTYSYAFEPENVGLFGSNVHSMVFNAEDES